MCDMLGISTSKPLPLDERLWRLFFKRGRYNPDGWGVAWYWGKKAVVTKSPRKAGCSTAERFLKSHSTARTNMVIAHLRGASIGGIVCENTHPFHRSLFGKEYVFAHNGHLDHTSQLPIGRFTPYGQTDSERIFCHLLYWIEKKKIKAWTRESMAWLAKTLRVINKDFETAKKRYGKMNLLFSDGSFLFFYHDIHGFNRYWTLQQYKKQGYTEDGPCFVVSMTKLTRERWARAKQGFLVVVKNGEVIYCGTG
ncbi:class II glutamine amidotransferase [Candidatus Woesearchaeota archaeon]|nr:class II glutamine amidotransferase [Candidatus Woesearchaeota archaeon]